MSTITYSESELDHLEVTSWNLATSVLKTALHRVGDEAGIHLEHMKHNNDVTRRLDEVGGEEKR
jgi:hypothetical protein